MVHKIYDKLISLENLFSAWDEFKKGKRNKLDVQRFEFNLEQNIFQLHRELKNQTYRHGPYETFHIYDPKFRVISKATVKDRLVHHLVFKELYQIFELSFIYHSYSSRRSAMRKSQAFFQNQQGQRYSALCFNIIQTTLTN